VIADLHLDALLDVLERRELGDDDAFAQRHLPMLEAAECGCGAAGPWTTGACRVRAAGHDPAAGGLAEADRSDGRLCIVGGRSSCARRSPTAPSQASFARGVEALGRDASMIRALHRLGVRMAGLTWNRANVSPTGWLADGIQHPGSAELLVRWGSWAWRSTRRT
jgi:microsomal dipeptidase-like Zn-dependent dipeptidase